MKEKIRSAVEYHCNHDWPDGTLIPEVCPYCDKIVVTIMDALELHIEELVQVARKTCEETQKSTGYPADYADYRAAFNKVLEEK